MNRRNVIIVIALLIGAALAVNASGVNLQGFLQKKPNESGTITTQDEQRPVMTREPRQRGTASDDGAVQLGQGSAEPRYENGRVVMAAPAVGQVTVAGPGSGHMNNWIQKNCGNPRYANQYPCTMEDANGNACQIGTCKPAEIEGLPGIFNER